MAKLFGYNAVSDALKQFPSAIEALFVDKDAASGKLRSLIEEAEALGLPIKISPKAELREHAGERGGAQVAVELRPAPKVSLEDLDPQREPVVVALDRVTDPHNLGAIMRSCAAFGVRTIIQPKDHSAPLNHAATRASAGALSLVSILQVTNLARSLTTLYDRGYWPAALDPNASQLISKADLSDLPLVLVMGAEGQGLRPLVASKCPLNFALPMTGTLQSLNVSVASGIALYEVFSQRQGLRKL